MSCKARSTIQRVGPYPGKSDLGMILSRSCVKCSKIIEIRQEINWKQEDWIKRWNRRMESEHDSIC